MASVAGKADVVLLCLVALEGKGMELECVLSVAHLRQSPHGRAPVPSAMTLWWSTEKGEGAAASGVAGAQCLLFRPVRCRQSPQTPS